MSTTAQSLVQIRSAIEHLRVAARQDQDVQRARTAHWLEGLFADVADDNDLRAAMSEASRLFRGGMSSFQDVGTAAMHQAVERLRQALS